MEQKTRQEEFEKLMDGLLLKAILASVMNNGYDETKGTKWLTDDFVKAMIQRNFFNTKVNPKLIWLVIHELITVGMALGMFYASTSEVRSNLLLRLSRSTGVNVEEVTIQ